MTEKAFGARLDDVLKKGCADIASTAVLGIGRYFRIDDDTFVILGRDQDENEKLLAQAMPQDVLLRPMVFPGPVALVRARAVKEAHITLAAGLCQFYSKLRGKEPLPVACWRADDPARVQEIVAGTVDESDVKRMSL